MLFSPLIGLLMRKINQRKSANQEEKVDTSDLDPIVDLEDSVLVIGLVVSAKSYVNHFLFVALTYR